MYVYEHLNANPSNKWWWRWLPFSISKYQNKFPLKRSDEAEDKCIHVFIRVIQMLNEYSHPQMSQALNLRENPSSGHRIISQKSICLLSSSAFVNEWFLVCHQQMCWELMRSDAIWHVYMHVTASLPACLISCCEKRMPNQQSFHSTIIIVLVCYILQWHFQVVDSLLFLFTFYPNFQHLVGNGYLIAYHNVLETMTPN